MFDQPDEVSAARSDARNVGKFNNHFIELLSQLIRRCRKIVIMHDAKALGLLANPLGE